MWEDLSAAKYISLDIETHDPDLKTKGSGVRRNGFMLGIAVVTDTSIKNYYPICHPDESNNLPSNKIIDYLNEQITSDKIIIGANILYDLEYLSYYGLHIKCPIYDVLIAEPLIDENQFRYDLDMLGKKYLGEGKLKNSLELKAKEQGLKGDIRQHLSLFTSKEVGEYALQDALMPIEIIKKQLEIIDKEELTRVWDIECRLLPLLLQMKLKGCRIDIERANQLHVELKKRRELIKQNILDVGLEFAGTDSGRKKIFDFLSKKGLQVPMTPKTGKPSLSAGFLRTLDVPEIKMLLEYKTLEKFLTTFIESQIFDSLIGDRIHAQFNSMRASDGGTVTGRFSSSKPNLQNIPAHNPELGKMCRSLFIPEEGELYGSLDYSQIEYRILCHFARGDGADKIREDFNENPHLDVHTWCSNMAGISRKHAKMINFGIIYGQGSALTAKNLGLTIEEAKEFLALYNKKMPFAKETMQRASRRASHQGYVRTILNRRRRFDRWESEDHSNKKIFSSRESAVEEVGERVRRAETYKALNAVIQGSSADLLKLAMVNAYEAGIFNVLTPLTTVHDELNVSVPNTNEGREAFQELKNIMETCHKFKVPIIAEGGLGKDWADAKG